MRVLNRAVSAVLALVLIVGGVIVALEVVAGFFGREEPLLLPWDEWYRSAVDVPWSDPDLRLLFAALLAAGVGLLWLEATSRRPVAVAMAGHDRAAPADLDRRGLERWLGARVSRVHGVSKANVHVTKKGARVDAATPGRETARVRDDVVAAAGEALGELDLAKPMPVRVRVHSGRASS
jgi:hypothetical protein